jgi:hypothetical protein
MRNWMVVPMALAMVACGGEGGAGDTPNDLAAQACKTAG